MLEVDLATQFNPQNQQLYADAQESCQQCVQTIQSIGQDVSQVRTETAAAEMPVPTTPTEHQVSISTITPDAAEEQVSIAKVAPATVENHVSVEISAPSAEKSLVCGIGHSAGDSQDARVAADCMETGSQ